ncbi:carbohydrate ABC transporter permease [Microbacterium sp. NPDC058389]|uniref:carbohydrate ABC transporter permease n=1 Tax=Microbacterium sp. NPDC058389 TaxID=3346475 RepID=UPI00364FB9A0
MSTGSEHRVVVGAGADRDPSATTRSTSGRIAAPADRGITTAGGRRHRISRLEPVTPGMGRGILLSILPGVLLFSLFFVIPLVVVAVTSFTEWGPIRFEFTGVDNFARLFGDDRFWMALGNTAFFVAAGVLIQVPVGVALAVILSQRIRGWKILRTIYFLPNIVSYAALSLVYLSVFNPRYGLFNQVLGWFGINSTTDWLFDVQTALPAVASTWVFTAGVVMILVMAEITAIPQEIFEAARVEGASRWQVTRHITLPLLRPVIGSVLTIVALATLAYFDGVYIMTQGGPADRTLTLALFAFQEYSNSDWGYANTIAFVLLVSGVLVILGIRRTFRVSERDL